VNSDNIKYVIRQSVERNLPQSVEREIKLPIGTGKVVGLAGARRAGKTKSSNRINPFLPKKNLSIYNHLY
jgi:ABC-type lipopolysaccharide export system ATPase subunit